MSGVLGRRNPLAAKHQFIVADFVGPFPTAVIGGKGFA
jgi:hypothetical protein